MGNTRQKVDGAIVQQAIQEHLAGDGLRAVCRRYGLNVALLSYATLGYQLAPTTRWGVIGGAFGLGLGTGLILGWLRGGC